MPMPVARRPLESRSYADARAFNTVAVVVKARDELAGCFGDTVDAVRPKGIVGRQIPVTLVVADDMVGARVNDAGPCEPCRPEYVLRSKDIGGNELFRGRLEANAAEVDDGGSVLAQFPYGIRFCQVSAHELGALHLVGDFAYVAHAQLEPPRGQSRHEPRADFTCRTGYDDHADAPSSNSNGRTPGEAASVTSNAPSSGRGA